MLLAGVKSLKPLVFVPFAAVIAVLVLWLSKPDLPARAVEQLKQKLGSEGSSAPESTNEESWWFEDKWPFQADVLDDYDLPTFNVTRLKNYPPHNYKGPGHPTFATFYASHNATDRDPYFIATQQVIYRLLWDSKTGSKKYPVTVFVPDFVRQDHRDYFAAAGALVRQIDLIDFQAEGTKGVSARFQDQFSKLELWRHTDFSRIAFMDCDAFALRNCDEMFEPTVAPEQVCKPELMKPEDWMYGGDMCDYVFSAHPAAPDGINGGVLILKPDIHMYERLRREMLNTTGWNTYNMEQAFLSYAFDAEHSPYPVYGIHRKWNAFERDYDEGMDVHILHDKMWAHYFENGTWQEKNYKDAWANMLELYNSEQFGKERERDKMRALSAMMKNRPDQPEKKPPQQSQDSEPAQNIPANEGPSTPPSQSSDQPADQPHHGASDDAATNI